MIVVTGAAGFIGSCILAKLNSLGHKDVIIVDHIGNELKRKNFENKKYIKYYDKLEFLKLLSQGKFNGQVDCIIHMGACSSTTLQDADYFKRNNLDYTRTLAQWALENHARFIYASSAATYGDGADGYKDDDATIRKCKPLNLYGQSKQDFDLWVLNNNLSEKFVGLKFFNVFGPNEYHKDDMRSVIAKAYQRVTEEGKMSLFRSYRPDYKDGEQKRDFIYVKDVVDVVMFFFANPKVHGIFNVGTGEARTWVDLANALFSAVKKKTNLEFMDMPESLRPRYQYFTQADMGKLRKAGYQKSFTPLEESIKDYVAYLRTGSYI